MAMLEAKKEGKDLSTFEYCTIQEEDEKLRLQKLFRKRQIAKTPHK